MAKFVVYRIKLKDRLRTVAQFYDNYQLPPSAIYMKFVEAKTKADAVKFYLNPKKRNQ